MPWAIRSIFWWRQSANVNIYKAEQQIFIHDEILSQFSTTNQFLLDFTLCEENF